MQELVLDIMNRFGYPGIGALILIETIFPPIPSEVILVFGGFLTTCTDLTTTGVILVSTLASLKGAFLLYALGRFLKPERLHALMNGRLCRRLGFQEKDIADSCKCFERKGKKAVFLGRCVPIVRSLISIPAGMAGMHLGWFTLYTAAGSLIWDTLLVLLGAAAGESWEVILEYMDAWSALVKIGLGTLAVTLGIRFLNRRKKKGSGTPKAG